MIQESSKLRMLSLFSGIGGIDLGAEMTGAIEVVAFCEKESHCQCVLHHHWPHTPIFEDIRHVTTAALVERGIAPGTIDIAAGGPPCQGSSTAGKRLGREDDRYLWPEFLDVIRDVKPRWIVAENPTGLLSIGVDAEQDDSGIFGDILRELAKMGYSVGWCVLSAADAGAPHLRERVFIIAYQERRAVEWVITGVAYATQHGWIARGTACQGLIGQLFAQWRGESMANAESGRRKVAPDFASRRHTLQQDGDLWSDLDGRRALVDPFGERCNRITNATRGDDVNRDTPEWQESTSRSQQSGALANAEHHESSGWNATSARGDSEWDASRDEPAPCGGDLADAQCGGWNSGEQWDARRQTREIVALRSGQRGAVAYPECGESQPGHDTHSIRRRAGDPEQTGMGGRGEREQLAHPDREGLAVGGRSTTKRRACTEPDRRAGDSRQTQRRLGDITNGLSAGMAGYSWPGWPAGPGQPQHDFEPHRTITETQKDRAAQLKALGNAVVPLQIFPVFAAIVAYESASGRTA